jgi:hypothetical protein
MGYGSFTDENGTSEPTSRTESWPALFRCYHRPVLALLDSARPVSARESMLASNYESFRLQGLMMISSWHFA